MAIVLLLLGAFAPAAMAAEWPRCTTGCTANDASITNIWLVADPHCTPGENTSGELWATVLVNRQKGICCVVSVVDIYVNGNLSEVNVTNNVGHLVPAGTYDRKIADINWTCGSKLTLENIYAQWIPKGGSLCPTCTVDCNIYPTTAKCYYDAGPFEVPAPFVADFTFDNVCLCTNTTFTDKTTGGVEPYIYDWDFGDGSTHSTDQNATHHYVSNGTYTVNLTVTDSNTTPNVGSQSYDVEVYALPDCNITLDTDAADGNIYANTTESGHTASVADAGTEATYTWTLTNCTLDTGVGTNITWHADTPGTANINITVTDNHSCKCSEDVDVTVNDPTAPDIMEVTQNLTEPCAGQSVLVTARVTDDVNVTAVNLTYDETNVSMTMVNGTAKDGNWTATIPGQLVCTTLTIYVTATDGVNTISSPPHEKHWKDCTPPVIVNVTQSSNAPCADEDVEIIAHVTDDVNVTSVDLTYGGTTVPMIMINGTAKDGNWTATIPGQLAGTTLTIFVTATDGENTVSTEPHEKHWFGVDISVEKTADPTKGAPSTSVTFTITVKNTGDFTLDPVKVVDTLPGGMSYVSSSSGGSPVGNTTTWNNVGPLDSGDSTLITLVANITSGASGTLRNRVNVTGAPPEGVNVTDFDTADVTVQLPRKVPAMTPLGMIALIGLLSVVVATSIRMRKRK